MVITISGVHKINIKHLAASLGISLGVGALSAIVSNAGMDSFKSAEHPPLTPPDFLFPIVWTILFILMGISAYLIFESSSDLRTPALVLYGVQLAVNFFWPVFFFTFQAYLWSFIWILLLWVLIIAMIVIFSKISKPAAILQIPYLLWVTFAAYLNFGVYLLN